MTETEQTELVEKTGDTETSETEVVSFVDENGVFKEGWQDAYVPEDFRGRSIFNGITSVEDAMKKMGNQEIVLSKGGKMVTPLADDATQTEKDEFYKALGRPETASEYELIIPDELGDYIQPELVEKGKELFHAMGLNAKQAELAWQFEQERITNDLEQIQRAAEAEQAATKEALEQKWGPEAYADRMHFAKRLVEENTTDENKEALLNAIGNNQHILEFVAEFGQKFKEASRVDSDGSQKPVMTKEEHRMKAKELAATPGYIDGRMPAAQKERIQKEIRDHYAAIEE